METEEEVFLIHLYKLNGKKGWESESNNVKHKSWGSIKHTKQDFF